MRKVRPKRWSDMQRSPRKWWWACTRAQTSGSQTVLSTSITCILTVSLAEGGGLQEGMVHMLRRRCPISLASPEGFQVGWDCLLGMRETDWERKRLHCLWAYFSKYKMKLSSRQPFFFFFTKIIWDCFPGQNILYSLCAHSTCRRGLNWSFVPNSKSLWSI